MILDRFKLDGKVAVVTGASRGLGQAMAAGLAQAGADVVTVSRSGAADAVAQVEAAGRKAADFVADIGDRSDIPRIVDFTVERFGRLDILINNAGIIRRAPLVEFSEKDWDDVMKVNLDAVFFLSQAVARVMIQQGQGGKIVNIASMLSFQGGILVPSYTASKSAVMGLTRLLANELAAKNINVNAIAPGYMATENTRPLREDKARNAAILSRIPAGRWGDPEDIQGAVVFLASAAADYMHGYTIAVDGGWLAR
ncbi:MAG: 2-dehydro-3-deoxy-D-gluconate 5-dehydrogenase KduD [Sedimentisphaerales bacterium]|nr:2-dehydro-3-deoxy-D-gluconate 5-dehydrogenase KduD [Sedimentisphaerales bacterium]